MLEQKTISVRIDGDLYEYFKEEEIPISEYSTNASKRI